MSFWSARPWRRALAWLALLAPLFYLSYGFANYLAAGRAGVPSVVFAWEHQIPFWGWTVFPYWSINAFYGLSLLLASTKHELDRHGLRLLSAQIAAVTCFIAFPLAYSFGQPEAEGAARFMFDALRSFDKPFNQAPSLHIALAVILWDFYRRRIAPAWARAVLHVWTLLICFSVLTTFQHHFIDIPTGALLGLLCVWLWPLERRAAPWRAMRFSGDARRGRLALAYGTGALALFVLALHEGGAGLWLAWPAAALLLVAANYLLLGERGFAKDRSGRMPWALRWMLAPYRLGAWLNSRWWTRAAPHDVEIAPGVWLGRLPAGRPAGMHSAVDLTAEFPALAAVPTLCVPMLDLAVPSATQLRRAACAIERQRAAHGSVLVYCALGYSRSAAALAVWLVRSGTARDAAEAVFRLRLLRPQVVLGPALLAAINAALPPPPGEGRAGDGRAARPLPSRPPAGEGARA